MNKQQFSQDAAQCVNKYKHVLHGVDNEATRKADETVRMFSSGIAFIWFLATSLLGPI